MAVYDKNGKKLTPQNSTPEEREAAEKAGYGPEGGGGDGGGGDNNPSGAAIDMFDFQNMMKDYYESDPSDDAGIASKRTFQQNMIQAGFDSQLAMAQAEKAQEYDLDARRVTAELELANQTALMKDTYQYGMKKMGAEYKMQSRFATDEQKRLLDQMASAGDIQQNQTKLEGKENRLGVKAAGQQDRKTLQTSGQQQRRTLQTSGQQDRKTIDAQADATLKVQGADAFTMQKSAQRAQYKLAMDTLVEAGVNERKLQEMVNSGALDQIKEQGLQNVNLQELIGEQEFAQLSEQGKQAISQLKEGGAQTRETVLTQAEANIKEKKEGDIAVLREQQSGEMAQLKQQQAGDLGTGGKGATGYDYVDLGRIGAQGVEARAAIAAQADANEQTIQAQALADERKLKVAADADIKRNTGTVQADVDRATGTQKGVVGGTQMERDKQAGDIAENQILTQGEVDVNKIGATGSEQRKTMQEQTRQTAADRANQRKYSRELAAR